MVDRKLLKFIKLYDIIKYYNENNELICIVPCTCCMGIHYDRKFHKKYNNIYDDYEIVNVECINLHDICDDLYFNLSDLESYGYCMTHINKPFFDRKYHNIYYVDIDKYNISNSELRDDFKEAFDVLTYKERMYKLDTIL